MTTFDFVMIGVLAFSMLISLQRGFVREALSLAAWVAGVILSRWYGNFVADLLSSMVPSAAIRVPLGHFLVFFLVIIAGAIIGYLLKSMLKAVGLSLTDRLLGCAFGLVRGLVILVLVVAVMQWLDLFSKLHWWQDSLLLPHILAVEDRCRDFLGGASGYKFAW